MKIKLAILGSLAVVGAGIWYLFFRNQVFETQSAQDPVGPINRDEHAPIHAWQVMHKSKELIS
jgi:hypothetical protein